MSISNSIRKTLNIKDKNIFFDEYYLTEEKIGDCLALVFNGSLRPEIPHVCLKCGTVNNHCTIIRHGTKTVSIRLPQVSKRLTLLKLKKQRFFCKSCKHTFLPETSVVKFNHSISENTMHAATLELKDKSSIKDIAKRHDISHTTLNNHLHFLSSQFSINKNYLPPHLCFDEFKSVKEIHAHMSFICTDDHGRIVDIVQNRQLSHLKSYFFSFSANARNGVQSICIDMYAPYIELIRSCFPNAKIITDRFHVVQLLSRSLNRSRIKTMKDYPKMHARLKRYWKLILKANDELDTQIYRKFVCFRHKMTEREVVNELLRIDKEFEDTYWYYQEFLRNFKRKNTVRCQELIDYPREGISEAMKKTVKTLKKHETSIMNALKEPYSNGVIEGTNNLIKVIKRIAFGYRSYDNFRTRILLITNTLVLLNQH